MKNSFDGYERDVFLRESSLFSDRMDWQEDDYDDDEPDRYGEFEPDYYGRDDYGEDEFEDEDY